MASRHIKVSGQCPACGMGAEDTKHLLFTCAKTKEVWRLLGSDSAIDKACVVGRAGEAVIEFLLLQRTEDCVVLGRKYNGSNSHRLLVLVVGEKETCAQ